MHRSSISLFILGIAALAACSPAKTADTGASSATPQVAQAAPPALTLPLSLNAVMVSLVDHASEPLWVDAYKAPKGDAGWREAEYDASQMALSGKLIQLAGTGPNDVNWVAQPDWKPYADEMSNAGMAALKAAEAKDVKSLNAAGDRLVAACETCHKKFKPDLPSMGLYKSPSYPPK